MPPKPEPDAKPELDIKPESDIKPDTMIEVNLLCTVVGCEFKTGELGQVVAASVLSSHNSGSSYENWNVKKHIPVLVRRTGIV